MDLVNLRVMDDGGAPGVPLPEQLGTLEDLRAEGKLDLIGVSNVTAEGLDRAVGLVDVAAVQNAYSVLDRRNDPLVDRCIELDIAFVPFFPLGSAFRGGPAQLAADPAIGRVADRHGATPAQVALAWLLRRYERILLIPGTTSVAHLEENLGAATVDLDEADLELLDAGRPSGDVSRGA
jgi:pyridoxine 4-dehydrogenase